MTDPSRFIAPPGTGATTTDEPATSDASADATPAPAEAPSAAEARFQSCRWRKAETPPYCSHPEVLPFAGTTGFKPDAWCPGCSFYKLRRNPRREY
jgi:hypothetical protein